ncbi:endonuclease/exonuclease/phosphatase family protein [Brevundimonas nasdae]|uniref:Endonuclease/exonuclease/phosphatase family protein n=1 Tax=Brevundimonas nasdae TaxID=172043 RepID=A0ABX8TJ47_9CAUL|nr:endonuclease/exonuclease/phosphatase family protein [Brevundimonas nasdae]QYC11261.1 endonuclease/exonuclease/phosphatase family protein [Brevundimonas nasdae]QYC14048.1 endonuclease/exonuclease/phosphatase family protein [Brevundimonas nasdae]
MRADKRDCAALKLVTFNIWHNQGDWNARRPLLVAALRAQDADIIALQEVLEDADVGLENQAQMLARELGGYHVAFVSTDPKGGARRYGNALLTRLPILAEDSVKLEPLDDFRTALRLRVEVQGRPVDVVATHLAWQDDAGPVRAQQIASLLDWLPQDVTPLVVMGDFNADQQDPGLATMTGPRFFSALPRSSAVTTLNPAKGHPNRVIDHIFAETTSFAPEEARIFGDVPIKGEYPSDHFGVAATIKLK